MEAQEKHCDGRADEAEECGDDRVNQRSISPSFNRGFNAIMRKMQRNVNLAVEMT